MKFLLNTVQYEVVPAPNEGDEVQQAPQDQHGARTGGSGMKRSNGAPGHLARVTRFINIFTQ